MQIQSSFLYSSVLSADAPNTAVADIIRTARQNNPGLALTGLLVFDDENFCQYLEGPTREVSALVERIAADKRHVQFKALHAGPLERERRFRDWGMAYAELTEDAMLNAIVGLHDDAALAYFERMLPSLDIR